MTLRIPGSWSKPLENELGQPYFEALDRFVEEERARAEIYPPPDLVFAALEATPFDRVKVVLLGQDPYHGPGQAHGFAFSVEPGVAVPPSLVNVWKELGTDIGAKAPGHGSLRAWADQGVLLLNTVLTVRKGEPGSHARRGWEKLTDAAIRALSDRERPVVFLLLGAYAKKKTKLIDGTRHRIIEGVHPSPLSAHAGFFGSKPFSRVDEALRSLGESPIDWRVPPDAV